MVNNIFRANLPRLCLVHQSVQRCLSIKSFSFSSLSLNQVESAMRRLINVKQYRDALRLYDQSYHATTAVSSTLALKACAKLQDYQRGVHIHQQLSSQTLEKAFIQTSLIHFYMQCQRVDQAEKIFSKVKNKTIYMYGAMFTGYISNGMSEKVFHLFDQMSLKADAVILITFFNACADLVSEDAKKRGREVFQQLPRAFLANEKLMTSAVDMLMKFGDVTEAEQVFHSMKTKTVFTYTAMMKGYVFNDLSEKALDLFETLPFKADRVIYVVVYNACASLANERATELGKKLLNEMPKQYFNDVIVVNSATHMFMKISDVENAERLFSQIRQPTLVTYGVMMNGYKINYQPQKCLQLLDQINGQNMILNEPISVSLVNACSQIGLIRTCQRILKYIPPRLHPNPRVASSLIDMWGKAGAVNEAYRIFHSMPCKDNFIYTTMINSYGRNGMGLEAVEIYRRMPADLRNTVTYVCVLNACSHSGLVDEAQSIFTKITFRSEHIVTVMVDCYSRMSMFEEARKLIDQYEQSHSPSIVMYMALLSGARNRRQSDLAQKLYDRMRSLFPHHKSHLIAASILVGNIYSSIGDYDQSQEIRNDRIKHYGSKVTPGITWTEVSDELVEFRAHGYHHHPRANEIQTELTQMGQDLLDDGHQYESSWITRPLRDDESIESVLCGHSEKLAIAYNFIQKPSPSVIQLTKNLRVCGDCHEATKRLARIRQVDIIVRDANRIHHFSKNGQCSCQDHF